MKILSKNFVKSFPNSIINIHPSLLPKFKGLKTYQKVLKNKEKKTGCTVHYVNEKLDCGKIIKRKYFFLEKKENEKSLKNKTQKLEHKIYSEAIIDILKNYFLKKKFSSLSALDDESEPCTEFLSIDTPYKFLIVLLPAFFGSVAPMISLYLDIAFSPDNSMTIIGPEER